MDSISTQIFKIVLSIFFGALIGIEREISHKPAGLRTHMLVCLSATLITTLSLQFFSSEAARISAAVISGIGFLGAGTIIANRGGVMGLTTAANLWAAAMIGIAVGLGAYLLAGVCSIIVMLILSLIYFEKKEFGKKEPEERIW